MKRVEPKKVKQRDSPELKIRNAIRSMLWERDWLCETTHGNEYQQGFPDLFCAHKIHGMRWVEVKLPDMIGSSFTKAQMEKFPKFCEHGAGIWILTAATEHEYKKLFDVCNFWYYYMKKKGQGW